MERIKIEERLASSQKVLIGLGSEWQLKDHETEQRKQLCRAYEALYKLIKDKDYFIITMATDALIYETALGDRTETVACADQIEEDAISCLADEQTLAKLDRLFPKMQRPADTRWQRIVAPCGNETWRQCSHACTKDIWEPGELPADICPHCGAPLTGNTIEAETYIEEGYLPQWNRYTKWLTGTLNKELLILELGAGFKNPGVIRFPFEKTAFFNQKAHLYRVNAKFPQITEELNERATGIQENSITWLLNLTKATP